MTAKTPRRPFRSREWFADPARSDMTALYLERFMNYGLTPEEIEIVCGVKNGWLNRNILIQPRLVFMAAAMAAL